MLVDLEVLHDFRPMRLHCFDADRKLSGDDAVQLSRDHQILYLTFALGKLRKARLFRVEIALCATQKLIAEQTVFCQGDLFSCSRSEGAGCMVTTD